MNKSYPIISGKSSITQRLGDLDARPEQRGGGVSP